ncbi:MAG: nucleoside-diphosphate kinase [Candidatus Iainarchaeum archaeon]|uniref:Nucleoside diphosphate kinase n=1 Tax=Candidatus Iainarchaeum sp. TaxID=3101447 RepID=A0A497JH24_9ARCH|nr:MAG: nucleoside-diphosphate kinase [Candidatus Diapherotrites archaeon]
MLQKTLIILKPDAVKRGLIGKILARFEEKGIKIVAMKMVQLNKGILEKHYAEHKGKPFYEGLVSFMQSGPVVLAVLEGFNAIEVVRKMVGATNGREAEPGTIRGDYSMSQQNNLIHASADTSVAEREIKLFFKEDEILDYEANEHIVYAKDELKKLGGS